MCIPSCAIMPPFVLFLGKIATFALYMRYSLISYTTHPTKEWLGSFVNNVLGIVSLQRLFWVLHIKGSVHPFKSLFLIHPCVVLILVLHITSKLSMHSFCRAFIFPFSLVFLNSLNSTVSLCVIVRLVLTATSNGSILFLMYHPRSFSPFFILFTSNKSSCAIFPRNIHSCNITSWV